MRAVRSINDTLFIYRLFAPPNKKVIKENLHLRH